MESSSVQITASEPLAQPLPVATSNGDKDRAIAINPLAPATERIDALCRLLNLYFRQDEAVPK